MLKISAGTPTPLGSSKKANVVNFAIFSQHADAAFLCLFDAKGEKMVDEIKLDKVQNRTGYIWHIAIEDLDPSLLYGYRFKGPFDLKIGHLYREEKILSDPYAKELFSPREWGAKRNPYWLGKIIDDTPYDWQNVPKPHIPLQDLIVYEMHVRGFTQDSSSHVKHPGTFKGVIEKIPYLKDLGVNAVELLPVFEFDELSNKGINPLTKDPLYNYWGYATINFFCPMNRFADSNDPASARDQFRDMVKELHKNGIEVILDVVYNHTNEGELKDLYNNFRGIDNAAYYMWESNGHYFNFSGCGNTFNCNAPAPMKLIMDSLHYWAGDMGVDGFRFDLASILTRDPNGYPLSDPPIIKAMSSDPLLSQIKLIAEPWDAAGLYQVGLFPSWGSWEEWNDQYRDPVRKFIKGTDDATGAFATAICGSQNIYGRYGRQCSVNFVTSHDGFSLYDLVTYQNKHNFANGEQNRDGMNNNENWNCGYEGPTDDPHVNALREKQIRNFFLALLTSQGVPMILMGDEYGHTRLGNNNTWCHDNEFNWFLWDKLKEEKNRFRFLKGLIEFRKNHPILRHTAFLNDTNVTWHGVQPYKANWDKRFIAFTLKDPQSEDLYLAFNSKNFNLEIHLPEAPRFRQWYMVAATFMPSPDDYQEKPFDGHPLESVITLPPHSAIMAKAL